MATNDVLTRKDAKLGTGISDDFYLEHDGTDSTLQNDTGNLYIKCTTGTKKTIIDNGVSDNQFVVDHDNNRIGINNSSPSYLFHAIGTTLIQIVSEYTGGSQAYISGGLSYGFAGTVTNHPFRLVTFGTSKVYIAVNGDVTIPAAFTTIIGGSSVDLYIDPTGLIGPLPSFKDAKENIRDLTDEDTSWIYNIPVKMCDYKDGTKDIITVIAEDAETVNSKVIRYVPFEIKESGPVMINRTEYKGLEKIQKSISPGEEKEIQLDKIIVDIDGNETIKKITKRIKLKPFTTNKSDFIYPLVKEFQKKSLILENLLTRVNALELKAGIVPAAIPTTESKKGIFRKKTKK